MPMEASMNVGVRPIERPQAPSVDGVGRRGDGGGSSAAFSPKTNVSIQNAVDDMAGVLAKISSNQMDAVEKMPEDLQKLIKNVMKQAFSLEETLAQGLGSTLESQRFSMEQLSSFSRMLTQMGKLMERGMTMEVSDTMQALLTNLKNLTSTEQGPALEPVLLTKAAFELLDNKPFAELPKEVQQLLLTLAPQGMVQQLPTGETNSLNFLKQLVQYFMPRPASNGEIMQPPQGQAMPNSNMGQMPQPQQGQAMPNNNMGQMPQSQQGQAMPNNNMGQMPQPQQGQAMPNNMGQMPQQQGQPVQRNVFERMPQAEQVQRPQQAAMQQAKNQLLDQVMENTPQTMNVLKDLAQLLLKDGNVNQKDALLLQSFINGKAALLSAKEAQQLQQMIRLCQANIPATVQQAALQQNIPDLPRLWAFMQLCDMSYTRNMTDRQLKRAGKDVAAFVLSMRNSMEGDNSIVPGQRSLNFMMPMYMGEESTYPAYIHVYDEKQPDPETGEMKKETWLRLCVLTDNIGAVELTCRVYQENQLDMRLFFSSTETANEFRAETDALRNSLKDNKLRLKELKIGAVGERRFM